MKKTIMCAALLAGLATPAFAEQGDVLVRLRAIAVVPNDDSGAVLPAFPTGSVTVDESYVPEIDFTYFLTDNIGAELILATSGHDISGAGALAGLGEIADTMVLPPTLTLQYHFVPDGTFRPYVGAGVNWTIFYDDDAKQSLITALGPTTVNLENSVGWAVQAGFDYQLTERVFFNADVKYIDIDTTATLNTGGTINTVDVEIDPLVVGLGFGMRF